MRTTNILLCVIAVLLALIVWRLYRLPVVADMMGADVDRAAVAQ